MGRAMGAAGRLAWPLFVLVLLSVPAAGQDSLPEGVTIEEGTGEGVRVLLDGVDIAGADAPLRAVPVDPARPGNLTIRLSPPPGVEAWEIRGFGVGLLVSGPGSTPPASLTRNVPTTTTIPQGYTVVINRTLELEDIKGLGAGVFLMQVTVADDHDATLYAQSFYVHVVGNPFLTASGAIVTVMSVATGYGLWTLLQDLREFWEAYKRHRKEKAEKAAAKAAVSAMGKPRATKVVSKARELHRERERLEKGRRPVRWTATGLGLGAVALSWAQFLGYVAFDLSGLVITTLEVGAVFLTLALVLAAVRKNLLAKAPRLEGPFVSLTPDGPARSVPVEEAGAPPGLGDAPKPP